jgi:flagellar protein FliS
MWNNAHEVYLENRVMAADRLELVRMLYSGAMEAVRTARAELAAGRIAERSRAIGKAYRILAELATSLDSTKGGEVAERLLELYDYMMRRLNDANFHQKDEPLSEVLDLLDTLAEAWAGVIAQTARPSASSESWESAAKDPAAYTMAGYVPQSYSQQAYAPQAWSF